MGFSCVKPSNTPLLSPPAWKHCQSCGRCALPDHPCGRGEEGCFNCGSLKHKRKSCLVKEAAKRKGWVATILAVSRKSTPARLNLFVLCSPRYGAKAKKRSHHASLKCKAKKKTGAALWTSLTSISMLLIDSCYLPLSIYLSSQPAVNSSLQDNKNW